MTDLQTAIDQLAARLVQRDGFRLPLHVASVAANGAVLFTRYDPPPPAAPAGSATSEHIAGEVGDEGFGAPIHIMVTDATGHVRLARLNRSGTTTLLRCVDPDDPAA